MESELWNLLSELITRTLGQAMNFRLEKVRAIIPETNVQLQSIVTLVDSLLHHLEDRHRQRILTRILSNVSVWIEHIWHYSASCLRVFCDGEDSCESIATVCRVALQESWYTDIGSPVFTPSLASDSLISAASSRPVVYLSPAAPSHLRKWLSLNLCSSHLLVTVLPSDENVLLPNISVPHFEKIIHNDLRLGRQPLLLVAYAGSTLSGCFDCLPKLARICKRHKMWLHVEGLAFLRMALLASPPTEPDWVKSINSINLELALCLGLPRSLNVLLMQSSMPESILLYLNVFPITSAVTVEDLEREPISVFSVPRSLPSNGLANALFAWFALRTHDGSHVNRLRHSDHLTVYTLRKMQSLKFIEVLPSHQNLSANISNNDSENSGYFIKLLYENSEHCPIVLFRYVLPEAKDKKSPSEAKVKMCVMSESSTTPLVKSQYQSLDLRFLNSLNQWLASALQFEHPEFSIKTHFLAGGMLVLRFSLLDSVNLTSITDQDIDKLIDNVKLNCTIMEATWHEKPDFCKLVNSTPGLYYYNLPDWAGLGAAFYVPHTYRCLLPVANDLSPTDYQNHLINALLRLPLKAALHICDLNRELISRLRNHDYAFSSAQVNLDGASGIGGALDSLASNRWLSASNSDSETKSVVNKDSAETPNCQAQLYCLRFGLITPETDTSEMVQLVLRMANAVEEDSNYLNNLSEVVKRGIEEATLYMQEERAKIMQEQGILRQLPYLDRLVNWWSPPANKQIHGQTLNLSIGQLMTTESMLPKSRPSPPQQDRISSRSALCVAENEKPSSPQSPSSSIWSWFFSTVGETSAQM